MDKSNLIALCMFGSVIFAGIGAGGVYLKNKKAIEFAEKYPAIFETYDFMKDTDIGQPENVAEDVQINSFLKLYDDKYTYYGDNGVSEEEKIINNVNTSPTACGCGFQIDFDENTLYFSEVTEDMPAYEQGFRTGDIILSINGENITTFEDAKKLMGKKTTTAEIKIQRDGKEQEITLTRFSDTAKAEGIESKKFKDTLYIKYSRIGDLSTAPFLDILKNNSFNSLIIDLRNNPGGEISVAVSSADPFINKAEVRTRQFDGAVSSQETNDGVDYDVPIVLLVNENTASSAEIFTALLKQYADTTIIGTNTFGKGIYQNYAVFKGNYLQYTAGYTEVGDWETYNEKGIAPDIEIAMDYDENIIGTDEDIQLQKAIEILG